MALVNCCQCGDVFERDVSWKTRCLACWRENKEKEANKSTQQPRYQQSQQAYQQQRPKQAPPRPQQQAKPQPQPQQPNTSHYQREITRLRQEVDTLRTQLLLEKNRSRPSPVSAASGIPEEMLGRLIRLAHPDRHNNSEASNKATAWLLSQRKGSRR